MQTITHGGHTFDFKKSDVNKRIEKIYETPDEESDEWKYAGEYEQNPLAGYHRKFVATGTVRENIISFIECPICGVEVDIKEEKGKVLRTFLAEDARM